MPDFSPPAEGITTPAPESDAVSGGSRTAVYFDGMSSRRRMVVVGFSEQLEISEEGADRARWAYDDIRRVDGPPGLLRVGCLSAPALARLEIGDATVAAELVARCGRLDENSRDGRGVAKIIAWSLAATLSIIGIVVFAIPFAADRLAPLVPQALERRLGDAANGQVKAVFGDKICNEGEAKQVFSKLMVRLSDAAGLDNSVQASILATPVANAFALPGGRIYLFSGLLAKAENADEIASILAHELGHLKRRDGVRELIHNGGTSFLIGLLFGDVTGSSAVIFASRSLLTASYSREAEQGADTFAIDVMHKLGRSPKGGGELLFRVTGKEAGSGLSILASHPLTEDRMARMRAEDRPASGPPLLTDAEWIALKTACARRGR